MEAGARQSRALLSHLWTITNGREENEAIY